MSQVVQQSTRTPGRKATNAHVAKKADAYREKFLKLRYALREYCRENEVELTPELQRQLGMYRKHVH